MRPPCTCGHERLEHDGDDELSCTRCACAVYVPSDEAEPDALFYGW